MKPKIVRNIAFAAAAMLGTGNLTNVATAKDKDCEALLGMEDAFTLEEGSSPPLITLNGGDLGGIGVSFNDDLSGMRFSQAGQTENIPFVSTNSTVLNGSFEAPFTDGISCQYLAASSSGENAASVFCGNTGIHLIADEIAVTIQAGEVHMKTPFITQCTSSWKP